MSTGWSAIDGSMDRKSMDECRVRWQFVVLHFRWVVVGKSPSIRVELVVSWTNKILRHTEWGTMRTKLLLGSRSSSSSSSDISVLLLLRCASNMDLRRRRGGEWNYIEYPDPVRRSRSYRGICKVTTCLAIGLIEFHSQSSLCPLYLI